MSIERRKRFEEMAESGHLNVRWQAQMELHLEEVRDHTKVGGRPEVAIANGLAAIALAIANTVGDLELPMSKIADALEKMSD